MLYAGLCSKSKHSHHRIRSGMAGQPHIGCISSPMWFRIALRERHPTLLNVRVHLFSSRPAQGDDRAHTGRSYDVCHPGFASLIPTSRKGAHDNDKTSRNDRAIPTCSLRGLHYGREQCCTSGVRWNVAERPCCDKGRLGRFGSSYLMAKEPSNGHFLRSGRPTRSFSQCARCPRHRIV